MADAAPAPKGKTKRELLEERFDALDQAYNPVKARHVEISDFLSPDRTSFTTQSETSKGGRKDQKILDNTASDCAKKLTAAIETGCFSAAREWARTTTLLGEDVAAEYLYDVQKKFFFVMAKSNLYQGLGAITRDDVEFGTGVLWLERDMVSVVRGLHFPVGSYRLGTNARGRVDSLYRQFEMTTGQMVREFGKENCSLTVQQEWDQGKYDIWHWIQHSCEPRQLRQYGKIDAKNKPWESCWFEVGSPDKKKLLRESGFDRQPFIAVRWNYIGQQAYGIDCPGMQAIGDIKQLQDFTTAGATAVAGILKPAKNIPPGLRGSLVPGASNHVPGTGNKVEATYTPDPRVGQTIATEKGELRARIRGAFLNNILFFLTGEPNAGDAAKTATEINARKDEGLLQLSSAYKIFSDEGLDILVDFVLYEMQVQGLIDPPPEDLHVPDGRGGIRAEVHVEYINNLAAAQKLLGISAVERLLNTTLQIFQGTQDPSVLDNVDFDQAIHLVAETLSVKPSLVRKEDVIKLMRQQRQQAQQQKAVADQAAQSASALKDVSQTDPEALNQLAQRYGGYAQSQVRF